MVYTILIPVIPVHSSGKIFSRTVLKGPAEHTVHTEQSRPAQSAANHAIHMYFQLTMVRKFQPDGSHLWQICHQPL